MTNRLTIVGALVLLAVFVALVVFIRADEDAPSSESRTPPDAASCAYANTVLGWLMRVDEDSRAAPLRTAARSDDFRRAHPEAVTLDAFQQAADLQASLTAAVTHLTPPDRLREVHARLVAVLERLDANTAAARDAAAIGDTDRALRLLRDLETQLRRDLQSPREPIFNRSDFQSCLG